MQNIEATGGYHVCADEGEDSQAYEEGWTTDADDTHKGSVPSNIYC